MKAMITGAIMLNAWAIAVFFWRLWKRTGDKLFWHFAAAFLLLGIERVPLVFQTDGHPNYVYLIRLCAFVLIAAGIVGKNVRSKRE